MISDRNKIHGLYGSGIHNSYRGMIDRCYRKSSSQYKDYGGRGIKVCQEWLDDFMNFYNDVYESYQEHIEKYGEKNTSIDRKDVNGDYCKDNYRWATREQQNNNRRNNVLVEINGAIKNLTQWAREYNIKKTTIEARYKRGWRGADLIKPVHN